MFKFQPEHLVGDQLLGGGAYGAVYPYRESSTDDKYDKWVVKIIQASSINNLMGCLPEIVLGFACEHPCVVPIKGYFIEKHANMNTFQIFMKSPRMKKSLLSELKERKAKGIQYTEKEVIKHLYSLVCGLSYLHSKNIYHRDIKHDNLLLDAKGNLKIADVGIAKYVEDVEAKMLASGNKGTFHYSAPEILGENATKDKLPKADIWSLGIVILELCVLDFKQVNSQSSSDEVRQNIETHLRNLKGKYHESLVRLIKRMISLDPMERPSLQEIKSELEKNFSNMLDKGLVNYERLLSNLSENNFENLISILNKRTIELNQEFEEERKNLKNYISELSIVIDNAELNHARLMKDLTKQETVIKELEEKIKILEQELDGELRKDSPLRRSTLMNKSSKDSQALKKEKEALKQLERTLESYISTSVEEQMKIYQDQIQNTQGPESMNGKLKFETCLSLLESKVKDLETIKSEQLARDHNNNLPKVVTALNNRLNGWVKKLWTISFNQFTLKIDDIYKHWLTDDDMKNMTNDLIPILQENNLLDLFGLEINCNKCIELRNQSLTNLAEAIKNPSLHLKYLNLNFSHCKNLEDESFADLMIAICNPSLHLQYLTLNFENCEKLTNTSLENLGTAISTSLPYLQHLSLNFSRIKGMDDDGIDKLATKMEVNLKKVESLHLFFESNDGSANQVSKEKKESLKEKFSHVSNFQIK